MHRPRGLEPLCRSDIGSEARNLLNPEMAAKCYKRQTSSKNRIA